MKHVEGKVKILHLEKEEQLITLQRQAVVLSTAYESSGLTARVMDERQIFTEPAVPATLEDAYIYAMGKNISS